MNKQGVMGGSVEQIKKNMAIFGAFSLLFILTSSAVVSAKKVVVYEEGYSVSTVLDGNKVNVNPHSLLPLSGSSDHVVLLDSANSAFYTLSLSKDSGIKPLAGKGADYLDGNVASAKFNKPRSFAVDVSGNVYVADRGNFAIRKISKSGVSTIAGGYSTIPGHTDGPGKNATFSSDFELTFIPEKCALMICDHGHKLIRQINLKPQDCAKGSQSAFGVTAWAWALAVGVCCCLIGLVIGFSVRPYITSYDIHNRFRYNATWKHYRISLGRQIQMLYFDNKNAIVSSNMYACLRRFILLIVSHLSLMLSVNNNVNKSPSFHQKSVSLLDSVVFASEEKTKLNVYDEQMKSLIAFDAGLELRDLSTNIDDTENKGSVFDFSSNSNPRIDSLIEANFSGFVEQAKSVNSEEPSISSLGLVKRR